MKRIFVHLIPLQRDHKGNLFIYAEHTQESKLTLPKIERDIRISIQEARNILAAMTPFNDAALASTWIYHSASSDGIHFYYDIYLNKNTNVTEDSRVQKLLISEALEMSEHFDQIDQECIIYIDKIILSKTPS